MTMSRQAEAPTLAVSIVLYRPDLAELRTTLDSLVVAIDRVHVRGGIGSTRVWLVDNGSEAPPMVDRIVAESVGAAGITYHMVRGHGNVGYGAGHNRAIRAESATYHLVLNPDVTLDPTVLETAVAYLEQDRSAVLVAPAARDRHGNPLHLCKRYPSAGVLLLRGFAPARLRRAFDATLASYEMRELAGAAAPVSGITIASGCFMLMRGCIAREVGGFDERFFLYFEDFDLSLRLGTQGSIVYLPGARIVHHGGYAARKGWRHVRLFARSAITFFGTHGWAWW